MQAFVYTLASGRNGTLYIGVTSDLPARIYQHREGLVPGFISRHGITKLVHCEILNAMIAAIQREKTLKKLPRQRKLELIEKHNPNWQDLYETINC
ncbi:MAG: GIY-YIG nuclease family protein [Chitinophagales bacterium]|nr:GIY-YIG nuclease family protein [Hyphomicrobiales bacterium]